MTEGRDDKISSLVLIICDVLADSASGSGHLSNSMDTVAAISTDWTHRCRGLGVYRFIDDASGKSS
jgi:hypothetical protein